AFHVTGVQTCALPIFEVELGRAREAARAHQLGELHRLGREAQPYAGLDDPAVHELQELLAAERQTLAEGGHARRLGEAALLLDRDRKSVVEGKRVELR